MSSFEPSVNCRPPARAAPLLLCSVVLLLCEEELNPACDDCPPASSLGKPSQCALYVAQALQGCAPAHDLSWRSACTLCEPQALPTRRDLQRITNRTRTRMERAAGPAMSSNARGNFRKVLPSNPPGPRPPPPLSEHRPRTPNPSASSSSSEVRGRPRPRPPRARPTGPHPRPPPKWAVECRQLRPPRVRPTVRSWTASGPTPFANPHLPYRCSPRTRELALSAPARAGRALFFCDRPTRP